MTPTDLPHKNPVVEPGRNACGAPRGGGKSRKLMFSSEAHRRGLVLSTWRTRGNRNKDRRKCGRSHTAPGMGNQRQIHGPLDPAPPPPDQREHFLLTIILEHRCNVVFELFSGLRLLLFVFVPNNKGPISEPLDLTGTPVMCLEPLCFECN